MTSATGRRPGFTLVEVLVSVSILSLGAVTVMQALGRAAAAVAVAEARSQAHQFCVSRMGEVELSVRTGKTLEESDSGSFQEEGRQFFWSLTAAPPKENPLLLPVSLTVRWNLGKQPYEYSVQTVFRLPPEESA